MVFKFLGKGKKSEFFMEAPPLSHEADPAAKLAEAKRAVEATVTGAVTEAKKAAEATVGELKETVAKVSDVIEEKTDKSAAAKNGAATAVKPEVTKAKKFKKAKADAGDAKAAGKPADKAAEVKATQAPAQPEPASNFATDFLMPSGTPRRRPGPSMNAYRDMAKDVTPRK